MGKTIRITKGANIKLKGAVSGTKTIEYTADIYAVQPSDFAGLVPKLLVKVGEEVQAGSPLFYDKFNEKVKIASPVSGEIVEIERGEKRKLLSIKILADKKNSFREFGSADVNALDAESIKNRILESGAWAFIKQRPYDVISNPDVEPKHIFISCFDSTPLAPDLNVLMQENADAFQTGINALAKLTKGKVNVGLRPNGESAAYEKVNGVDKHYFSGPHPAGNVGIQIHHISPINKGEVVWCIAPQDVILIGKVFTKGIYDASRTLAIAGSEVQSPKYVKATIGVNLKGLIEAEINTGDVRIISGNVFTGTAIARDGFLGTYATMITAIPEGNKHEFFGWLSVNPSKFSLSRAFTSWIMPKKEYVLNTNQNGEERAFVMSGQYENYFPMDVMPVQLLKSILTEDVELMEQLGIYEVAPEDFALCEFACTSKIEVQHIVRKGLDMAKKELG
jgi:Na+-transporting NADH:ubiquinone oxidoreductase subunit A